MQGNGALSYELEGQREYGPLGPFQSKVSLNLDSVRNQRDAFVAGLHGLKANVPRFQDLRLRDADARKFVIDAAEKVFRVAKEGRFCAAVSDPLAAPNGQLYGGAMVTVHPHYSRRAVANVYDNRGLGWGRSNYSQVGKGTLITYISVYLTPSPRGE